MPPLTMPQPGPGPDLGSCADEPIHIPGSIQPHGALCVLDPASGRVIQAAIGDAAAAAVLGDPVGRLLRDILPPSAAALMEELPARLGTPGTAYLGICRLSDVPFHIVAHANEGGAVIEFERAAEGDPRSFDAVYPHVRAFLEDLQRVTSIEELTALVAREIRRMTGLDRAMVYRFDEQWNGAVIAEDRNDRLPSYLGLRFPDSDIPAQARELYRVNRLRLIADATYAPAQLYPTLNPLTGKPLDLSFSVLRSVSPVHLEYMRNMGTAASMSISLLRGDRLWGLISCHNADPRRVPYHIRMACDFIGQILSLQLPAREASLLAEQRESLRGVQTRLLAHMAAAEQHFIDGLISHPADLLALTRASGAAIVSGGACHTLGETPAEPDIHKLVEWLGGQDRKDLFITDHLAAETPDAEALIERASGVLAVSISQLHDSYVLWFRPEVVRTVSWGGDPRKVPEHGPAGIRLHPRRSFERWQETVRQRAAPWHTAEVDAAVELRTAIVDIVLRRAEELAALTERLVSINRELEAFSYSVSHDLRAPFRHIVGYAQLLKKYEGDQLTERGIRYLDTIVESALSAGTLVDQLLSFSHMGRAALRPVRLDMNELFAEVRKQLLIGGRGEGVDWHFGTLAPTRGDPMMLRLVVQNLLDNAIKFSRNRELPIVEVGCEPGSGENIYYVRDNGAGFDMAYVGKLFGVFQRLHRVEDYDGTGIGLANVKRIVERHGGRVWAEGRVDEGATFFFALPAAQEG